MISILTRTTFTHSRGSTRNESMSAPSRGWGYVALSEAHPESMIWPISRTSSW